MNLQYPPPCITYNNISPPPSPSPPTHRDPHTGCLLLVNLFFRFSSVSPSSLEVSSSLSDSDSDSDVPLSSEPLSSVVACSCVHVKSIYNSGVCVCVCVCAWVCVGVCGWVWVVVGGWLWVFGCVWVCVGMCTCVIMCICDILSPVVLYKMHACICSAQSRNLCNLEIALCILRILKLRANLEIAHWVYAISRLCGTSAQSRDRAVPVHNLEIAQFLLRAQLNPSSFHCIQS